MTGHAEIFSPNVPHPRTFAQSNCLIAGETEQGDRVLVTWCKQNQCGAIYHMRLPLWSCYSPIAFQAFLELLDHQKITLPEGDRATWCRAVAGNLTTVPDATH